MLSDEPDTSTAPPTAKKARVLKHEHEDARVQKRLESVDEQLLKALEKPTEKKTEGHLFADMVVPMLDSMSDEQRHQVQAQIYQLIMKSKYGENI